MSRSRWIVTLVVFFLFPILAFADSKEEEEKANKEMEVYKQALEMVRHYSNLRFTALTVFITISSALLAVYLKREYEVSRKWPFIIVGLALALAFAIAQGRICFDLDFYDNRADNIASVNKLTHLRHESDEKWSYYVFALVESIHIGAAILWGVVWWVGPRTTEKKTGAEGKGT